MIHGDRRQDRLTRRRQFHPEPFDRDPTDRRVLLVGAVVALLLLVGLIQWL